jgi:AAHS family 4-hydroxybenzoate transporter-like MFS transporter
MTAKGRPASEVIPVLSRFDPTLPGKGYTHVVLSDERDLSNKVSPWAKFAELFRGVLAWITPLIWFTYFFSSFAIYLKASFGVLFLEQLGIERTMAANLSSIGGLVGAIGGVLLLWLTEKRGPAWIAIAPLLGVPLALWIGSGTLLGGPLFIPVILIGAITIGTGHAAVISITSIYYPSAVRSTGGGWASFMAKFAAVAAPILGGYFFLGSQRAVLDGYLFTGLCLAGVVLGLLVLSIFARRLHAEQTAAPVGDPATAGA